MHSGGSFKQELQGGQALPNPSKAAQLRETQLLTALHLHQKATTVTVICTLNQYPKGIFGTFSLYFSIPLLSVTITEDGYTSLALIHPKPHGSSVFLTIFIDILMGPPLLNTRTKTSYLLVCVTDGQKPALTSDSRSISTFIRQHMLLLFTGSDHTGYWLILKQPGSFFIPWPNFQTMSISILRLMAQSEIIPLVKALPLLNNPSISGFCRSSSPTGNLEPPCKNLLHDVNKLHRRKS